MLKPDFERIPGELKDRPQWVCFRPDKSPVNPKTGDDAKANDPDTWGTFEQAAKYYLEHQGNGVAGVGYEFSFYDPFTGADLDKCRDPETGELRYCARVILDYLDTFAEASPSGTGAHAIAEAKWPMNEGNSKATPCGMKWEFFGVGKYFTVTGAHLAGTPTTIKKRQDELTALHRTIFKKPQDTTTRTAPGPSPTLDLSDRELIDKACAAGDGGKFKRLWDGDTTGYATPSEADYALVSKLAWWTNRDHERIDRLFRQSGLCRDQERLKKWERLSGKTIEKAMANTPEGYTPQAGKKKRKSRETAAAPEPTLDRGLRLTDWGCAERLVQRHGQDLRYCWTWEKWLVWEGCRWSTDATGEVRRRTKDLVWILLHEAAEAPDKTGRKELAQYALKVESDAKQKSILSSAMSERGVSVSPDDLDRDPWLFNVENGTVNLKTGEMQPHQRGDLITKLAPVTFDPEAEAPTWWKFLERIFAGNLDLMTFLQKAVGYALSGSTREQCLFFLYGLGANGKSTLLEILHTLLGDYAARTSTETFLMKKAGGIPNDVAALRGARLVGAVEVEAGRRLAEVLLKEITGGDRITARFLHSEFFTFKPEFKVFLAANHKPTIRGTDHAIWRRIHLIPFTVQISDDEQDPDLPGKLKAELPGILNWALEGCLLWQDRGLKAPEEVRTATQKYREEMDPLADFLAECCILHQEAETMAADLYKTYSDWAENNGIQRPMSQTDMAGRLKERGLSNARESKGPHKGKVKWHGIGLVVKGSE